MGFVSSQPLVDSTMTLHVWTPSVFVRESSAGASCPLFQADEFNYEALMVAASQFSLGIVVAVAIL